MKVESVVHWKTSTFLVKQVKIRHIGESRWRSADGSRYYTWDSLHGEIEVYNKNGQHIAVLNSDGSLSNKQPVAGRTLDG